MRPIDGHTLTRASQAYFLCGCGFALRIITNEQEARLRHTEHLEEVLKHRTRIADAQKAHQQSDFADSQEEPIGSLSPFRKPVTCL
jgi:hypothetical protein